MSMPKTTRSYMVRRGRRYLIERTAEGTFSRWIPGGSAKKTAKTVKKTVNSATSEVSSHRVSVTMTEYHFDMPATAKAGKTTFVIKNAGRKEHAFEIKGQGIDQKLSPNPKPGQTATLQVDLKPGTYNINCPLPFHTMRGMKTTLTVN